MTRGTLSLFAAVALAAACRVTPARRPLTKPQPTAFGVELERVRLTTWRGNTPGIRGVAERVVLSAGSFAAQKTSITTPSGEVIGFPQLEGEPQGKSARAPRGASLSTPAGCQGSTEQAVELADEVVSTEGSVALGGCGVRVNGARLRYWLSEHRAELLGPVATRFEALP